MGELTMVIFLIYFIYGFFVLMRGDPSIDEIIYDFLFLGIVLD